MKIDNERLINLFFKDSHTAFAVLDSNYNFIRVNEVYAWADDKSVNFFPGKNHFELYPSDAIEIFNKVKKSKKSFSISARPFVYPKNPERGVTYWDWILDPILNEEGEVEFFIFSLNDVTDRVKAEKERDRFQSLSKNLFCKINFQGYLYDMSSAFEKTFGYTESEMMSKKLIEFVHPEDSEKTKIIENRLTETSNEVINFINRLITKSGEYR